MGQRGSGFTHPFTKLQLAAIAEGRLRMRSRLGCWRGGDQCDCTLRNTYCKEFDGHGWSVPGSPRSNNT